MATPRRRVQPCEACKEGHLKCEPSPIERTGAEKLMTIGDGGQSKVPCSNCRRADIACVKASKAFRFRTKRKRAFTFAADQTWLQPCSHNLSFLDETGKLANTLAPDLSNSPIDQANQHPPFQERVDPPHHRSDPNIRDNSSTPPSDVYAAKPTSAVVLTASSAPFRPKNHFVPEVVYDEAETSPHSSIGFQEACLIRHFTLELAHAVSFRKRELP